MYGGVLSFTPFLSFKSRSREADDLADLWGDDIGQMLPHKIEVYIRPEVRDIAARLNKVCDVDSLGVKLRREFTEPINEELFEFQCRASTEPEM